MTLNEDTAVSFYLFSRKLSAVIQSIDPVAAVRISISMNTESSKTSVSTYQIARYVTRNITLCRIVQLSSQQLMFPALGTFVNYVYTIKLHNNLDSSM